MQRARLNRGVHLRSQAMDLPVVAALERRSSSEFSPAPSVVWGAEARP